MMATIALTHAQSGKPSWISTMVSNFALAYRTAQTARCLSGLSDQALTDLGIDRTEIPAVARKSALTAQ